MPHLVLSVASINEDLILGTPWRDTVNIINDNWANRFIQYVTLQVFRHTSYGVVHPTRGSHQHIKICSINNIAGLARSEFVYINKINLRPFFDDKFPVDTGHIHVLKPTPKAPP